MSPKPTKPVKISAIAGMADELGSIDKELSPFAGKIARRELLRKSIREHFDKSPAAESQTADGQRFVVLLGPKASVASIDVPLLAKTIGIKAALAILGCTLKALEAFPGVAAAVVSRALTGARSLKTFEKGGVS